ncbi:hypothetical protein DRI50_04340, partial [candidate division KSB1 bacterium]
MQKTPGFNDEELAILNKINMDVKEYQDLYDKGLRLIEKEPESKQLLTSILDDYLKRLDELPPTDISLEKLENYDDEIKEKIKSLILFGTQAVLIRQNSLMQEKLNEINQKYRDLLSVVTHEFKNSLTSIYGYNRIIKKRIEQNRTDGLISLTENIDRLTKNLFAMVDTLLNMFLIEDGKLNIERQIFDVVEEVIKPIADEVKMQLEHRKQAVKINAPDEKNIFYGDLHLMQVVFRNLFLNSIQYGKENSEIEITVLNKENEIEIHFLNYGNDIPDGQLANIFDKFSRFHKK